MANDTTVVWTFFVGLGMCLSYIPLTFWKSPKALPLRVALPAAGMLLICIIAQAPWYMMIGLPAFLGGAVYLFTGPSADSWIPCP